ncbi:MAG TPA: hypothetical protein VFV42_04940 [Acidimicrobiales bacterium]|nr:hypothetical protein [Acidimicrobiales bacterium]
MASSLLDRVGLGGERAVANARHEALRPEREAEIIAALVAALDRRAADQAARVAAAMASAA